VKGCGVESVHDLLKSRTRKARCTNWKLVLSFRSQFFHSLQHFSSQAKERSLPAPPRGSRQTALDRRTRLSGTEAGTRSGALRRPWLARLPPSCNTLSRRLWLPGGGAESFPPSARAGHPSERHNPISIATLRTLLARSLLRRLSGVARELFGRVTTRGISIVHSIATRSSHLGSFDYRCVSPAVLRHL
jgi:hypothetical protein